MNPTVVFLAIVANVALAEDPATCEDVRHHKNFHLLPKDTECGPIFAVPTVMDGKDAHPGQFPWMAQLLSLGSDAPFCEGTVISSKYVVTAAHCPLMTGLSTIIVRLGAFYCVNNNSCDSDSTHIKDFDSEEILVHKLYSDNTYHNDIAVIRVLGEIKFNELIKPICLPTSCSLLTKNFTGVSLTVMGWGDTQDVPQRNFTNILQTAQVRGFPQQECHKLWMEKFSVDIIPSQLCVRGLHGEAVCHGDSGGPLVYTVHDSPPRNVMVGVVSIVDACDPGHPSKVPNALSRVSSFMRWILDNMRE